MKERLLKTANITGGLLVSMILVGAIANAYGANIKITYITTPSPFLFVLIYIILRK